MLVDWYIVVQYVYQFLMKTDTCSMVRVSVQGIIILTWNSTFLLEHISQSSYGYIGLIDTVSKIILIFNYFMIIFLIINYRDISIILILHILIGIPLNPKAWKYMAIVNINGIHRPNNKSVVLGILNFHNQLTIWNQRDVRTKYSWSSSDTWSCIIYYGSYFLLSVSWKLYNAFLGKISIGDKVVDSFIGNTNHSYIRDELDVVVGLEPGTEISIKINSHDSSR